MSVLEFLLDDRNSVAHKVHLFDVALLAEVVGQLQVFFFLHFQVKGILFDSQSARFDLTLYLAFVPGQSHHVFSLLFCGPHSSVRFIHDFHLYFLQFLIYHRHASHVLYVFGVLDVLYRYSFWQIIHANLGGSLLLNYLLLSCLILSYLILYLCYFNRLYFLYWSSNGCNFLDLLFNLTEGLRVLVYSEFYHRNFFHFGLSERLSHSQLHDNVKFVKLYFLLTKTFLGKLV
jgi:hypothetical protein